MKDPTAAQRTARKVPRSKNQTRVERQLESAAPNKADETQLEATAGDVIGEPMKEAETKSSEDY